MLEECDEEDSKINVQMRMSMYYVVELLLQRMMSLKEKRMNDAEEKDRIEKSKILFSLLPWSEKKLFDL